ncbi:hypothetical protein FRB97_009870, partial [Tulasnella sp. 331]
SPERGREKDSPDKKRPSSRPSSPDFTPVWPRHDKWGKSDVISFVIEGTLYEIPEKTLKRSSHFEKRLHPFLRTKEPIEVHGVKMVEMDNLLTVLEARAIDKEPDSLDIKQWSAVLHLATMWGFAHVRDYAINMFDTRFKDQDVFDRIDLARKCSVAKWLQPAYCRLCERPDSLSLVEAGRVGIPEFVVICRIRDEMNKSRNDASRARIETLADTVDKRLSGEKTGIKKWCKCKDCDKLEVKVYDGKKVCRQELGKLPASAVVKVADLVAKANELRAAFYIMRFSVVLALALASVVVSVPAPAPAPLDLSSIVSDATSIAGDVTSFASSIATDATSVAGDVTSIAASVFTTVESVGGSIFTVITSDGGSAFTLATSGAGVVTSFGGSIYTVATAGAASVASDVTSAAVSLATAATGEAGSVASYATSLASSVVSAASTALSTATSKSAGHINSPFALIQGTPVIAALLATVGGILAGAHLVL